MKNQGKIRPKIRKLKYLRLGFLLGALSVRRSKKKKKNAELKKLYYQVYGTPCGGWYDGVSPNSEKNDRWLKNFVEGAERARKTPIVVIYGIPNRDCGSVLRRRTP